jgi:hypothetical protein
MRLLGATLAFVHAGATVAVSSDRIERELIDQVIAKLDLTSFPNSTGPRREPGKKTLADYGFVVVEPTPRGAQLYLADRGWMMAFVILQATPSTVEICLYDRGLRKAGDAFGPSYDARSALTLTRTDDGRYVASELTGGSHACANDPPK